MQQFIFNNIEQIILLISLLILSAIFSGCETAIFSLKNRDLSQIRKSTYLVDEYIASLYEDLPEFLLTILFGNMIVNILYFATATLFVDQVSKLYGTIGIIVFGVVSFCAVLILGEIAPKSVASILRIWFARIVVIPIYYFHKALYPVRLVLRSLIVFFERIINLKKQHKEYTKEIKTLLELEKSKGNINDEEAELLESVIKLPHIKVGEVMTSRVDVYSVAETAEISDVIDMAKKCGHNKIPVRSSLDDEYIAWVDARDLFFAETKDKPLSEFYRNFAFLSVYDKCDKVLDRIINKQDRIAFVLDERGTSAGILVLCDVMSELFGDFGDEESLPEEWIVGSDDKGYIINGRLSVRDWSEFFGVDGDYSRSNTIGGLITDILGRSANVNDIVEYEGIELTVIETYKRRIQQVSAIRLPLTNDSMEGYKND